MKGYADGTFRSNIHVNRAEFLKTLLEAKLDQAPEIADKNCFSDVTAADWFAPYVCHAKKYSIVNGYADGSFLPGNDVTVAEAAKILVAVFALPRENTENRYWFLPGIQALEDQGYLLPAFQTLQHEVTRGELAAVIWRIKNEKHDEAQAKVADILKRDCLDWKETPIPNVDMEKVRAAWLGWINGSRTAAGLTPYVYNDQLIRTAFTWSETMAERDAASHQRPGQTAYYDYNLIMKWFQNLGMTFTNVHGYTYTENIGWWPYRCSADDCTDEMIATLRHTFDMFMAEKNKAYRAHYDSVMNAQFREVGMSIVVSASGKAYNTTHYATGLASSPEMICPLIQ